MHGTRYHTQDHTQEHIRQEIGALESKPEASKIFLLQKEALECKSSPVLVDADQSCMNGLPNPIIVGSAMAHIIANTLLCSAIKAAASLGPI